MSMCWPGRKGLVGSPLLSTSCSQLSACSSMDSIPAIQKRTGVTVVQPERWKDVGYNSGLLITYYLFYFMAVNYIPSYSEIRYIHTLYFLFFTNWNLLLYFFFFLQMLKHALTLWCWFYNWSIGIINPCSQQVPQYCSSCKRSLKLLYY